MMQEDMEAVYVELVQSSWKKYEEYIHNKRMDDLLIGGVIPVMVGDGYALIDLSSDGINHYLRFEQLDSRERIIFRLTNLSEELVTAKVLGRHAQVVIGYGEHTQKTQTLFETFKSEMKSAFLDTNEPGVVTVDADVTAGYIYVQVSLIFDLDSYFREGYDIDYLLLRKHIMATVQSLQKYLRGRLNA
ncbi:MAG: hypothetical protein HC837_01735 [Chloroflexaceae bacterium]|nr:hypothetical protein [Chloroflexaceae bacterium]